MLARDAIARAYARGRYPTVTRPRAIEAIFLIRMTNWVLTPTFVRLGPHTQKVKMPIWKLCGRWAVRPDTLAAAVRERGCWLC